MNYMKLVKFHINAAFFALGPTLRLYLCLNSIYIRIVNNKRIMADQ